MNITRRLSLSEMIAQAEDLKPRWLQLKDLPVGSAEHAETLEATAAVLASWIPQGQFLPPGTPERRALRSMLDYWVGRLGDEGHDADGMEMLAEFNANAGVVLDLPECPYPGLLPYDASYRGRFFGRESLVEQACEHLELPGSRVFLIVGSSGSGKSSLALAGVLPRLADAHADEWLCAPRMTPGIHPIAALAAAVCAASARPHEAEALERALKAAPAQASIYVARVCGGRPLLLLVDQLEELLTLCLDGQERSDFAAALVALAGAPASADGFACRALFTLRADYKTRLESSEARALYVRLVDERNSVDMIAIGFADIRRTIQQTADAVGLRFVPATLVDNLASQTAGLSNGLPLLQFALQLLWKRRPLDKPGKDGRPLDLITEVMVRELPDVQRALGHEANGLYEGFTAVQKRLCERLMQELIVLDDSFDEPLRRRRDEAELVAVLREHFPDPVDTEHVLESFVEAHLIQRFGVAPAWQIEVAHEALLRHWPHIHKLLNSDAVKARLHLIKEVGRAAEQWEKNVQDSGYLTLPDAHLEWASKHESEGWFADKLPRAFLAACRQRKADAQQREAEGRLAKERAAAADRNAERFRSRVWVFGAAVAVLLAVGFAFDARYRQLQARSEMLANRANLLIGQDPVAASHLAASALSMDEGSVLAEEALRNVVNELDAAYAQRIESIGLGRPIYHASFSADVGTLVAASERQIHFIDPKTLKKSRDPVAVEDIARQVWLLSGNKWLLVQHDKGTDLLSLSDLSLQRLECPNDKEPVTTLAVSADLRQFVLGCLSGKILRWELRDGTPRQAEIWDGNQASADTVTALAFSRDAAYVASGNLRGGWQVWKSGTSKHIFDSKMGYKQDAFAEHTLAIRAIAFDENTPQWLVTGSDDKQAIVWKLPEPGTKIKNGEAIAFPLAHDREATMVKMFPYQGSRIALTVSAKEVHRWKGSRTRVSLAHEDWVMDFNLSEDGNYIATASSDGVARIWSTADGGMLARLRGHRDQVTRAMFVPGTRDVLTTSLDGTMRIWSFNPQSQIVAAQTRWKLGAAFDRKSGRVVACGEPEDNSWQCSVVDLADKLAKPVYLISSRSKTVSYPTWSSDGAVVLALESSNDFYAQPRPVAWDSETGEQIKSDWFESQFSATFSQGSPLMATVSYEGSMALWNEQALKEAEPKPLRRWEVRPGRTLVWLSPDGEWLAETDGNSVKLWRVNDEKAAPVVLAAHRGEVKLVRFSANSSTVVTASADRTACVWPLSLPAEVLAKACPVELKGGHTASLSSAAFSPDGLRVVTAGADKALRVWNATNGKPMVTLRVHGDSVNDVQFSPDGRSILSASDDGTVRLTHCEACRMKQDELRERAKIQVVLDDSDGEAAKEAVSGLPRWLARVFGFQR